MATKSKTRTRIVQRKGNAGELRELIRSECLRRVAKWAGPDFWNQRQEDFLRWDIGNPIKCKDKNGKEKLVFDKHAIMSARAKAAYNRAREALQQLVSVADELSQRQDHELPLRQDGPMQAIARIAEEVAGPALKNLDHFGTGQYQLNADDWTQREALVADFDRAENWWWRDRRPKPKELAVLSLLAGNGPDLKQMLKAKTRVSAADVIAQEARNIRKVQEKLGL